MRLMKDINGITVSDADIYIGRKICNQSWDLPTSKWSNPFYVKNYIHDEKSLWDYEQYIRGSTKLWDSLEELEGKTLGCWCWPSPCHGDILVKLLEEKAKNRIKSQLRGAGFELLSDSHLTGIRNARQWANHRIWAPPPSPSPSSPSPSSPVTTPFLNFFFPSLLFLFP